MNVQSLCLFYFVIGSKKSIVIVNYLYYTFLYLAMLCRFVILISLVKKAYIYYYYFILFLIVYKFCFFASHFIKHAPTPAVRPQYPFESFMRLIMDSDQLKGSFVKTQVLRKQIMNFMIN